MSREGSWACFRPGEGRRSGDRVGAPYRGGMNDKNLYAQILGVASPWRVVAVDLRLAEGEVKVNVEHGPASMTCPECDQTCPGYDTRRREWRHLDTCQYRTILAAEVPRIKCEEHGVKQIDVPWAAPGVDRGEEARDSGDVVVKGALALVPGGG